MILIVKLTKILTRYQGNIIHVHTCKNSDIQKPIFRHAKTQISKNSFSDMQTPTYFFWKSNLRIYCGKRKNKPKKHNDSSSKNSETQECIRKHSRDNVYTHGLEGKASAYSWPQNVLNSWKISVIKEKNLPSQQERI